MSFKPVFKPGSFEESGGTGHGNVGGAHGASSATTDGANNGGSNGENQDNDDFDDYVSFLSTLKKVIIVRMSKSFHHSNPFDDPKRRRLSCASSRSVHPHYYHSD